jgi:trimethylamine:corrinoid methyltransferase-like protein
MAEKLGVRILSTEEIEFLKGKIHELLAKKGITIEHPEVMKILKEAGAEVCEPTGSVKFPLPVIEEALKQVPREFTLAGIDPKYDLKFPHPNGLFYTRTNTGGMNYLSENGEYHHILIEEVAEWTRLTNALENIDFWSLPSTKPVGFPAETIDIHTLNTVLRNTKKHGWVQPYEAENIKYLIELAAAVVGGKEQLRKRPIISGICCSVPPLTYKYMDMNIIYECCKAGVPLQPCSLPTAGANVPITPSGIALVACAEVLAMIIMAQLIAPGTPCVATPLLFEMDMLTTNTTQSAMSTTIGRMMSMQLFEEGYGIPAHTYGTGTDSCIPDAQAGIEQASISLMVALAGASVLGGAGQVETAKTISPVQLIIDNDIFGMVRQLKAGYVANEETTGWNDILGHTGKEGFVDKEHTFRHFRDGYRTKVFNRDSRTAWLEKGGKDIVARAKDLYQSIKQNYEPINLPQEVIEEMDAIVKRADEALGKK